ncbi:MAG: hypothetical protein K2I10_12775 [Lachnospiraceae bacterium]|nr:hypothetical protein [Lachnospiraceae bacterium]
MFHEKVEEEYIVTQMGTSEGTQIKYKKGDYWYKKDSRGKEGMAEYLVSKLLTFSDIEPAGYVLYEPGYINDIPGCRSKNFLQEGEELVTVYRLYYNEFGKDLSQVLAGLEFMEERIEYVLRFIKQSCNLDMRDYLKRVIMLDMLVLNEDRHLNNLAVIFKEDHFICAPIFDNGVSLLTANQSVNWNFSIEENVKRVIARPFCGSHEKMYEYLGNGFSLDCQAVHKWLDTELQSKEKEVLEYQLQRYEKKGILM